LRKRNTMFKKGCNLMDDKKKKESRTYRPLSTDDTLHDALVPEEFPEGPVGSAIHKHSKVTGKSTEWEEDQQRTSAYTYADKDQHDEIPRRGPNAHPLHDENE